MVLYPVAWDHAREQRDRPLATNNKVAGPVLIFFRSVLCYCYVSWGNENSCHIEEVVMPPERQEIKINNKSIPFIKFRLTRRGRR